MNPGFDNNGKILPEGRRMVAPTRQQLRHTQREQARHGKQNVQRALNSLLSKIVVNNGGTL